MSLGALNSSELGAVADTLSGTDASKYGNREDIELQWAMKAYHHAETYFNLISSVNPRILKLTQLDDEIYKQFKESFPDLSVDVLEEDQLKTPESKARWREFCKIYEHDKRIEDYNMGTLIRLRSKEQFSEHNSTLVVRIQFLAIEITRNREGFNDGLRELKKSAS